ncbi:MAG: Gas vesicle protein [Herbinix sp.]|jgi:hypothetical protein|nr:Gas vesicle protein [Herbinix sp.]
MGLIKSVFNVFELIYEEGLKEWLDESKYMEALENLYTEVEQGKITEEEYEIKEAEILEELKVVRNYKKENGI